MVFCGERANFVEPLIALVVWKPDDLKRAVTFERATSVVVNALAGAREQTWCRVAVVHDEIGVGLIAL